jgi:hypothetical protein
VSVKIRSVTGTQGLKPGDPPWWRRFGASWWQDWTGILRPRQHNWSDFALIEVSGEAEWCMGTAELNFALCGFHLRFTYYWPNETREGLKAAVREILAGENEDEKPTVN